MTEPAGPSNQDGVRYQNSVAAQHMAELVSLQNTLPRDTVLEVRVEAPAHVDDVVVRYADGHRDWIQAKVNLTASGAAWTGLWQDFAAQARAPAFGAHDRLVIALGRRGELAEKLHGLIERAGASESEGEFEADRLGPSRQIYQAIVAALPDEVSAYQLLRNTELRVQTHQDIDEWFARLDLGAARATPVALLSALRDLVGGQARVRGTFRAPALRERLADQFGAELLEPRAWGLEAYRGTLARLSRIEVPGRGVSAPVEDLVVWPRVRRRHGAPDADFDDETPTWDPGSRQNSVDLSRFPRADLARCVLVAGPGMGKSTLITALVARLAKGVVVPAEIPLGAFAASGQSVVEFLEGSVNRDYTVRIDWRRLADKGLACVFFDGLDEAPSATRADVLKRINLFAARFPEVRWVLTVRDPAVLNGPLDGELLEIEPFDNPEISKLVEAFKAWAPELDGWAFTQGLSAYPDLARLARIPLFLSMMLAAWTPATPLPRRRSDLIEHYLADLFDPARIGDSSSVRLSGADLRRIAQALAFGSLEREEIGLSRRQALQVIPLHTDTPTDAVLSQLAGTGVLRPSADGRLQFPYPIVQEYLAATHLVDVAPDQISVRIDDAVRRPWAQVLQFALELLPDPTPQVAAMLERPDDVFATGLRLVGRCVANGAAVAPKLRHEIGARLADAWGKAHYELRERIGRILVDAYSSPLHPEVRARLGWRWLLGSGAGDIVARAADPQLTEEVVDQLLAGHLDYFMSLRAIQTALHAIAPRLPAKIAQRARVADLSDDDLDGLADFCRHFTVSADDAGPLRELADDETRPLHFRLNARGAVAAPLEPAWMRAVVESLGTDDWKLRSAALYALRRAHDLGGAIGDILTDDAVAAKAKDYLIKHLGSVERDRPEPGDLIQQIQARPELSDAQRDILLVYRLRAGDRSAMDALTERLDRLSPEFAAKVVSSLGLFPDRDLGLQALQRVSSRQDAGADAIHVCGSALTGLTHRIVDGDWDGYSMEEAPLHPSFEAWAPMFDRWLALEGLSRIQRLRLLNRLVDLRPEVIEEIEAIVLAATDPDAPEWDEDHDGHDLRAGMRALRRAGRSPPFALAEAFVLAKRANLIYAGVDAIRAMASHQALDSLLALYGGVERDDRSYLLGAIEHVAARLNVSIRKEHLSRGAL